jgi:diadenosine tetraphosphatase ApaH/serine/threonine PP2A family protein phosphatase
MAMHPEVLAGPGQQSSVDTPVSPANGMATPPTLPSSTDPPAGVAMAPAHITDPLVTPPAGRKAIFLGDLVDRGPNVPGVMRLVMSMVGQGTALCIPGNHDVKLLRKLRGKDVQITHGLAETLQQLANEPPEFLRRVERFIDKLVGHYVLDDGCLVVAHAGMKERYIGRASMRVREFALYGETTGETDEFGLPVRHNWAAEYRGPATVVYGHTPVPEADWLNRTINIDTGCVFGGKLTALRWPERELIAVPAKRTYAQPAKPFLPSDLHPLPPLSAQQQSDDVLDLSDVVGKRIITTRLHHSVTVREENATAALEVMSRFAANPQMADLSAADDVAHGDDEPSGPARASAAGVRLLPRPGRRSSHLRREAHGLARRRHRLPQRSRRPPPLRHHERRRRHRLHPHRPPLLRRSQRRRRTA